MSADEHTLSIGAVARLTGVPADTIRTWERRYQAVEPVRSPSGHRLYSRADVERVRTLSHLADRDERVSDLASLTDEQLRERLGMHTPSAAGLPRQISTTVVHSTLAERLPGLVSGLACEVVVVASATTPSALQSLAPTDVLVIDLATVSGEPVAALRRVIERVQPTATVVTTDLVPRPLRTQLTRLGVRLVQQPATLASIRQALLDAMLQAGHVALSSTPEESSGPRFSRDTLDRLLNTRPDLLCECPNHLASMVIAMQQFEVYSEQCASSTREDAVLHADLAVEASALRERLETLLIRVCEHDGIDWSG